MAEAMHYSRNAAHEISLINSTYSPFSFPLKMERLNWKLDRFRLARYIAGVYVPLYWGDRKARPEGTRHKHASPGLFAHSRKSLQASTCFHYNPRCAKPFETNSCLIECKLFCDIVMCRLLLLLIGSRYCIYYSYLIMSKWYK